MRFPFSFYHGGPADYIVKYVGGSLRKQGKGLVCLVGPRTSIVRVPSTDQSHSFSFTEMTRDGQQIIAQGELQTRLDIARIIERRDYSVDPRTDAYLSEDPDRIGEEVAHALQAFVRDYACRKTLEEMLVSAADLALTLNIEGEAHASEFADLGVKIIKVFVTSVAPANLDLKKALEAKAREIMLANADKAVADRRKAAAESDRTLKQYDAETAMTLERERAALIEARNTNLLKEATADAEATEKRMAPYKSMPAATLLALGIKDMAASGRIGQVNFTPDLLAAVGALAKSSS